jgi:8-oxo-dGTP pyrophosphatase MutT (NUDIX family)
MGAPMNRHGCNKAVVLMLWFDDKVMLTQRKGKLWKGWYAAVGGKVEPNESIMRAAQRELYEETRMYASLADIEIVDFYQENDFKAFMFEVKYGAYRFSDVKNSEPKKHSPWQLFTIDEALALPKLMPALRNVFLEKKSNLLTKRQVRSKMAI